MNKIRIFVVGLAISMALAQPLFAETLDASIKSCLAGQLSDEQKQALLVTISEVKFTFTDYVNDNIAACFTAITGQPSVFTRGQGLTVDPLAMENVKAQKDLLTARAETSAKERHDLRCALIAERNTLESEVLAANNLIALAGGTIQLRSAEAKNETVKSCNQWYADDKLSAMTNVICNEIFIESGVPDTSITGPTVGEISSAYSALTSHPKRLDEISRELSGIKDDDVFAEKRGELALLQWKASKTLSTQIGTQQNVSTEPSALDTADCP